MESNIERILKVVYFQIGFYQDVYPKDKNNALENLEINCVEWTSFIILYV